MDLMMYSRSIQKNTDLIKKIALELGFNDCKISKARFLKEEEKKFNDWIKKNYNAKNFERITPLVMSVFL